MANPRVLQERITKAVKLSLEVRKEVQVQLRAKKMPFRPQLRKSQRMTRSIIKIFSSIRRKLRD